MFSDYEPDKLPTTKFYQVLSKFKLNYIFSIDKSFILKKKINLTSIFRPFDRN
jgi:hypothetical protein